MLIQLFRAHVGKKPSVSCETITTISYISRMLTNRMISVNSGSCFATQQLRLWHTSISCSWPTAYLFWVLRDKNWKRRPFFLSHKFLHVSCLISMWYKFFVAFKDHVIWHTFSRFKAMCHITCLLIYVKTMWFHRHEWIGISRSHAQICDYWLVLIFGEFWIT